MIEQRRVELAEKAATMDRAQLREAVVELADEVKRLNKELGAKLTYAEIVADIRRSVQSSAKTAFGSQGKFG
jgi:hypothetical protein